MKEAKRDVAPPGWFGRLLAKIEHVMNFWNALVFCYFGGSGLLLFGGSLLDFHFKDMSDLLIRLGGLVISGGAFALGIWFFREWRRGRAKP